MILDVWRKRRARWAELFAIGAREARASLELVSLALLRERLYLTAVAFFLAFPYLVWTRVNLQTADSSQEEKVSPFVYAMQ